MYLFIVCKYTEWFNQLLVFIYTQYKLYMICLILLALLEIVGKKNKTPHYYKI